MDLSADFLDDAKALLGDKGWRTDPESLDHVSTPWRGTYQGHTPFLAMPESTEEVSALVKLCLKHEVAITPQGGNTGLVDAGTPHGEITLSMRRMQQVRAVDPFNNSLIIEAGAPLVVAQSTADDANRLFPLSLGSEGIATIGGLISTNAGGVAVLRYGMMRDLILGLEVVLPDGDFLDLDWSYSNTKTNKLIIVLHGLEGNGQRPYVTGTAKLFNENKVDAICVNFRGCSGEDNLLLATYHSGKTDDVNFIINYLLENYEYQNIIIVGFSLGGNLTLKYLGEKEDNFYIRTKGNNVVYISPRELTTISLNIIYEIKQIIQTTKHFIFKIIHKIFISNDDKIR